YAAYALGLLTLINLLNYTDRNVVFALFEPIKRELVLSDQQLGWLGSAYVVVLSLFALPLGVVGDLKSRRAVIAFGVGLWSACTALGAAVGRFWHLLRRHGVRRRARHLAGRAARRAPRVASGLRRTRRPGIRAGAARVAAAG